MIKVLTLSALLALASGCVPVPASTNNAANPCDSVKQTVERPRKQSPETETAASHLCGAKTQQGGACTRRVKGADGYCFQHRKQSPETSNKKEENK